MALDYAGSDALMQDTAFIGRVKVGCLKYADYITGEDPTIPAHATRVRWAQGTFNSPEGTARLLTPTVVMDPAVQQDGAAITDAVLQSAVENAVHKTI